MSKVLAVIVVLAIIAVATYAVWHAGMLNKELPPKWQHLPKSNFIGLNRSGVMVMRRGGAPGVPGINLNTSDWV